MLVCWAMAAGREFTSIVSTRIGRAVVHGHPPQTRAIRTAIGPAWRARTENAGSRLCSAALRRAAAAMSRADHSTSGGPATSSPNNRIGRAVATTVEEHRLHVVSRVVYISRFVPAVRASSNKRVRRSSDSAPNSSRSPKLIIPAPADGRSASS